MYLIFSNKSQLTEDIWQINFQKPADFSFQAGDYVRLSTASGQSHLLSLASAPSEDLIFFTIKLQEKLSLFKQDIIGLTSGQLIDISEPIGDFHLNSEIPSLLLAGGIGITPFRSMIIEQTLAQNNLSKVELFYGAKPGQYIYLDALKQTDISITTSDTRIEITDIAKNYSDYRKRHIFLSGPEGFCIEIYTKLYESGIDRSQLHLSYFPGYPGPWSN